MKFNLLILVAFLLAGCFRNPPDNRQNKSVFSIEGNPVYADEFLYNLEKNNNNRDSSFTREEILEYLDLYINFKLKVHEARKLGMDTTQGYKTEYTKYLDQLSESYLKDDSIVEQLVHEAYEHMKTEIKASHILVRIENPADPRDTLRAYRKIYQVYESALDGMDFNQLAVDFSEDPSAVLNRGNLGFFTALQMVYPFEQAAYSTPAGEISRPFKTRFGYHILKVEEIRPAQGKVEVAHIMLGSPNAPGTRDSLKLTERIQAIHDSLMHGGDWDYFCRKYSEDINSKENGGKLRPFETGRIFPSFSDAAFALNNPGEISQPVQTPYGWHIIKLIGKYPLRSFDELREELVSRIKQDSRSDISRELLINKLKKENGFLINQTVRERMLMVADSSLLKAEWDFDPSISFLDSMLFTTGVQQYSVRDFYNYVRVKQKPVLNMAPSYYFSQLLNDFTNEEIVRYEKDHLDEKYFDYRMLSREYGEGILLFDIMDSKVWSYAARDTAGLRQFFRENIDQYQWGMRLDAIIFRSPDIRIIDDIKNILNEPYMRISEEEVRFYADPEEFQMQNFRNSLDSLYVLLEQNESWMLEFSVPQSGKQDQILDYLKIGGYDISRILRKTIPDDDYVLSLVSVAKKDFYKTISDKWGVNLHSESGIYQKGENDIIDLIDWETGIHELSIEDNEYLVYVNEVLPPMDQDLNEVQGKVISDYQNHLEKQWIAELRQKYEIQINQQLLNNIISDFEKS